MVTLPDLIIASRVNEDLQETCEPNQHLNGAVEMLKEYIAPR